MAAPRGLKNEELNSALKSLAERGPDGEIFKKYNYHFTSKFLPKFFSEPDNSYIMFWAYGSAAEDLQSYDPCDAGDMDFMVFSNSDNLIINEELLEYSLENPLHVRIKGGRHPVLQSCLVEETEYVATSALKNLHSAIFGSAFPLFVDFLSCLFQFASENESPFPFTAHLKNNATSPAVTLTITHFVGSISKYLETLLVDSLNFPINDVAAEVECIAHFLCVINEINYTREHAELLNDVLSTMKIVLDMNSSFTHFMFLPQVDDIFNKVRAQVRSVKSRSGHKTVHANDQQGRTSVQSDDQESGGGNVVNFSGATLPPNGNPHARVAPQSCVVHQMKSPKDLEFTSSQSTGSGENAYCLSETLMIEDATNSEGLKSNSEDSERNGNYNEHAMPCNPDSKDDDEFRKLEERVCRWCENMFETSLDKEVSKSKKAGRVTSGADFIPASRSHGWPKVEREWVNRERKWPSHDIVDKVVQEGFHLVVKSSKNNGNPECDFRISFSHAEYLLSQEMNNIQRECYRCLKRYHRAYLSTQPKSLVSFHLKNLFLQTIEETGAEMWTESNRGDCMMKVLGSLLEALTRKDLRHFFVQSYNLFGIDYIESPEILEFLAVKVEEIMENPVRIAKHLIKSQEETEHVKKEDRISKKKIPRSESFLSGKPSTGQKPAKIEGMSSKDSCDTQCRKETLTVPLHLKGVIQECCPVYRYHDLKDIYQEVAKKLLTVTFDGVDSKPQAMDPLEMSIVEDLRELVMKYGIPGGVFPSVFNAIWHKRAYYSVWISTEPDIRKRVLVAIQGLVQLLKYHLKEGEFCQAESDEKIEALLQKILHPFAQNSLQLNGVSGNLLQLLHMFHQLTQPQVGMERPTVEKFKEFVRNYLDSNDLECGRFLEVFDLFLDTCYKSLLGNESDDESEMLHHIMELIKSLPLKEEDVQQKGNDGVHANLFERLIDLFQSSVATHAQPSVFHNIDGIPLD